MPLNLDDLIAIYPDQVLLEFSQQDRDQAWQTSQNQLYSHAVARWNAYLNRLCLNGFLNYLESETDIRETPQIWTSPTELPSIWEVVNGTAIELGETRLILIPSEAGNGTEFRVPREWIDIPEWAGNYYLAVEIDLAECWLRISGYATYQQLREEGKHDPTEAIYLSEGKRFQN